MKFGKRIGKILSQSSGSTVKRVKIPDTLCRIFLTMTIEVFKGAYVKKVNVSIPLSIVVRVQKMLANAYLHLSSSTIRLEVKLCNVFDVNSKTNLHISTYLYEIGGILIIGLFMEKQYANAKIYCKNIW